MAVKKNNSVKKKKTSILPLLVIVIVGFLAYKANPEYWQQGKLFEDLRNAGKKEVKQEEVEQIAKVEKEPEFDPNAILDGSVKGSKTIPKNINKKINVNDPMYNVMRSKFKTIYLVYTDNSTSKNLIKAIDEALEKGDMKDNWRVAYLLYSQSNKKQACEASEPQAFFCEHCDKKICLINPRKQEFIVVGPSVQASVGRAKALKGSWYE